MMNIRENKLNLLTLFSMNDPPPFPFISFSSSIFSLILFFSKSVIAANRLPVLTSFDVRTAHTLYVLKLRHIIQQINLIISSYNKSNL